MLDLGRGENWSTWRKTSQSKDKNQQQTQPTYDAESGNQTQAHWWEASALTTAPSLLPYRADRVKHKFLCSSNIIFNFIRFW